MTSKILIVGFACLSAVALAQSDGSQQKTASPSQAPSAKEVTSPRDAASGQASGKRMHKPLPVTQEDATAREASTGKATGRTAAVGKPALARVAAGDVNGDGKADVAAKNSGHASEQMTSASSTNSDVRSPRDVATGQASGKRTQPPASKEPEAKKDEAQPKK
ncbi:MAG: hypothetical protein LAO24_21055 [Acidobacteriia bacterium]|nr:hypothetical protein [Terriglobia bacterium]